MFTIITLLTTHTIHNSTIAIVTLIVMIRIFITAEETPLLRGLTAAKGTRSGLAPTGTRRSGLGGGYIYIYIYILCINIITSITILIIIITIITVIISWRGERARGRDKTRHRTTPVTITPKLVHRSADRDE